MDLPHCVVPCANRTIVERQVALPTSKTAVGAEEHYAATAIPLLNAATAGKVIAAAALKIVAIVEIVENTSAQNVKITKSVPIVKMLLFVKIVESRRTIASRSVYCAKLVTSLDHVIHATNIIALIVKEVTENASYATGDFASILHVKSSRVSVGLAIHSTARNVLMLKTAACVVGTFVKNMTDLLIV